MCPPTIPRAPGAGWGSVPAFGLRASYVYYHDARSVGTVGTVGTAQYHGTCTAVPTGYI